MEVIHIIVDIYQNGLLLSRLNPKLNSLMFQNTPSEKEKFKSRIIELIEGIVIKDWISYTNIDC